MICELNAPARPRSPVTSSSPTLFSDSCSRSSGKRVASWPAAAAACAVMPLSAAPYWGLRGLRGHAPDRVRVWAQRLDALLRAPQARGGDHLHRARDLLDVLHRGD